MGVLSIAPLVDLVLPRRCVGCGEGGSGLCPGCLGAAAPLRVPLGMLDAAAGAAYAGAVRAAVLRYKERGRRDLAAPLAVLLARALAALRAEAGMHLPVLVPVPGDRAAAAARGGDHMLRLARRAGAATGLRVAPGLLALTRAKQDSAGLDAVSRARNLAGAFAARAGPPGGVSARNGGTVIIVDDIVTTGATLREAARALRAAGWRVTGAAVVAATPRRPPAGPGEATRHASGGHWQVAETGSSVRTT